MKKGVSLLELAVVILILGLIFGFITNKYFIIQRKSAVRNLQNIVTADISYYKNHARNMQQDVVFDFSQNKIDILLNGKLVDTRVVDSDFTFTSRKVGFKANGVTKYAGTLYLYHKDKEVSKLIVAPVTGLYRWENL